MMRLPVPPSVNALFANVPGKGRVKTKAYREWITAAGWALQTQPRRGVLGRAKVDIACPENAKRDIDGFIKPILDLLVTHKLLQDDRCEYVRAVTVRWHSDAENAGYCLVELVPA